MCYYLNIIRVHFTTQPKVWVTKCYEGAWAERCGDLFQCFCDTDKQAEAHGTCESGHINHWSVRLSSSLRGVWRCMRNGQEDLEIHTGQWAHRLSCQRASPHQQHHWECRFTGSTQTWRSESPGLGPGHLCLTAPPPQVTLVHASVRAGPPTRVTACLPHTFAFSVKTFRISLSDSERKLLLGEFVGIALNLLIN